MKKITALILIVFNLFSIFNISAESVAEKNGATVISYALFSGEEKIISSEKSEIAPVGSVSKIFTAALILKLSDEGKISLSEKVTCYLPEFKMADERYKDIEVFHLLNHSSGIFGTTVKNSMLYRDNDSWNHDNFLMLLSEQRLKYNPGKMTNYCNDGYTLLQIIIERVTGLSYTKYLKEVFSSLDPEKIKTSEEGISFCDEVINSIGTGGIYSDAETLCKAINLITNSDMLKDETKMLMQSLSDKSAYGSAFGLGWDDVSVYPFDKFGIKALMKGGDTLYYHSSVVTLPEYGITAAVICKGGNSLVCETEAKNMIINYLKEKGINIDYYEIGKPQVKDDFDIGLYKKYEGTYSQVNGNFRVIMKDGFMVMQYIDRAENKNLAYIGDGFFDGGKELISFKEIEGKTYIITDSLVSSDDDVLVRQRAYLGVKRDLSGNVSEKWMERNGKVYLICDEKYSSILYLSGITATRIAFTDENSGYLSYLKLSGDDLAVSDLELPGPLGRDLTDIKVFTENGKEYVKSQGWTFVDITSLPQIYNGEKSVCTILEDGYTRWFMAGEAKDKVINAEFCGDGMFAVYNANGVCVYSSLIMSGGTKIPEGGYVAFSGNKGTRFEITLA